MTITDTGRRLQHHPRNRPARPSPTPPRPRFPRAWHEQSEWENEVCYEQGLSEGYAEGLADGQRSYEAHIAAMQAHEQYAAGVRAASRAFNSAIAEACGGKVTGPAGEIIAALVRRMNRRAGT